MFCGAKDNVISIPSDVYEDDAHIYLHVYVSRKRGNLNVSLVDRVTLRTVEREICSYRLWTFDTGCQPPSSALILACL